MGNRGDVLRAPIEEALYLLGCSIGPTQFTTAEGQLGELQARRDMTLDLLHRALGLTEPGVLTLRELMEWSAELKRKEVGPGEGGARPAEPLRVRMEFVKRELPPEARARLGAFGSAAFDAAQAMQRAADLAPAWATEIREWCMQAIGTLLASAEEARRP